MSNENNQYFVDSSPNDGKCQISDGVCEHVFYLHQQSQYIDDLRSQLSTMMAERDLLLCEVSRLKFELEIADIKRINEDRYVHLFIKKNYIGFPGHSCRSHCFNCKQ